MTVDQLKNNICEDLIVGAFERHERKFLVTRFTYPIGDSVNLYLVDTDGTQRISDMGTTHYVLKVANVDMDTDARIDFVKSVCADFGIEVGPDFVLSKAITSETAGDDVLEFCQAITRISALHYDQKSKQFQSFAKDVDTFISQTVPSTRVSRNWTDPEIDPQSNYPVDYRFNGADPPRNLFVVRSRLSAETAIGTMNFYLSKNRLPESMTVVPPELNLPRKTEKKIELSSRLIYGLNDSAIRLFARVSGSAIN
jgi:hypothetical protein